MGFDITIKLTVNDDCNWNDISDCLIDAAYNAAEAHRVLRFWENGGTSSTGNVEFGDVEKEIFVIDSKAKIFHTDLKINSIKRGEMDIKPAGEKV
jgi:hypothetical protein